MKKNPVTATDILFDLLCECVWDAQFASVSYERYAFVFSKSTFNRRIKELIDGGYVVRRKGEVRLSENFLTTIRGAGNRLEMFRYDPLVGEG